jgi:Phospholipase_D-nuclease N-terminal
MNRISLSNRVSAFSLLGSLMLLMASCSRPSLYKSNGTVSIFGAIYYVLAIITIIDIFKQDWSLLKKLIWTIIVLVPFGLILYYLVSGRVKKG